MALVVADRVKETTVTAGTGSVTLKGAYGGFQTFSSAIGDGNTTYYTIENFTRWEVGIGTYTSSSNTLSRDTILTSSNSNEKIVLDGISTVFVTYPANKALVLDANNGITGFSPSYSYHKLYLTFRQPARLSLDLPLPIKRNPLFNC